MTRVRDRQAPLVFIHGIKGAMLSDSRRKTMWLTGPQVLGLSTPTLALSTAWKNGMQPQDCIFSTKVLDTVTVIPFLIKRAIYGPWLKALETFDRPTYTFHYDWRRENLETLNKFETFMGQLAEQSGRVCVVAHSMGGLIAMAMLNRNPDIFHRVVFVGVPFGGGIGFLPDLHEGTDTGFNREILSWKVLSTFPSVYTLFAGRSDALIDEDGMPLPIDFFDADDWERLKLRFFAEGRTSPADWKNFLRTALDKAREFRAMLKPRPVKYPPVHVVLSNNHPSLASAQRKGASWDFESHGKKPGDGRVQEVNALPPSEIVFTRHLSENEHSELLNDPKIIELIRSLP